MAAGFWLAAATGAELPKLQAPVIGNSTMATLLPALRTAPAPAWVKPGVRATWYSAAASIPGRHHSFYRDDKGGWVDPDGNRYRREEEPSASGHGFTEVNTVAMGRGTVVMAIRSYGFSLHTGPPTLLSSAGGVDVAGCAGDWWVNPSILPQVLQFPSGGGTTILRMPWTIQNRTYQAISIQYKTQNARTLYIFDVASGVLLHTSNSLYNPASQRTMLSYSSYRNTRAVQLPWANDYVPNWLATVRSASYSGTYAVHVPGSPVIPLPMSSHVQVTNRGRNWLQFTLTLQMGSALGMPPTRSQSTSVSGHAQVGGLFVSPAGLAKLRQGQVLDRDPLTKVTIQVTGVGGGRVTVSEIGQVHRMAYTYDARTGMLVGVVSHDQVLNMRRELRLTGSQ